ncbi:MAG: hypothetical protein WAM44_15585 [Chthoniobacterales bacterium]
MPSTPNSEGASHSRVAARAYVDAGYRCGFRAGIEATPWDPTPVKTLGLKQPWIAQREQGAAGENVLRSGRPWFLLLIQAQNISNAAPLRNGSFYARQLGGPCPTKHPPISTDATV